MNTDRAGGIRQLRRRDVVLLVLAALIVGALTFSVALASSGERVVRLWAGAAVADDGSARVTEVIDWDFGPRDRHGIFRLIACAPTVRFFLTGRGVPVRRRADSLATDAARCSSTARHGGSGGRSKPPCQPWRHRSAAGRHLKHRILQPVTTR